MSTYLITGSNRGIGFAFVKQVAANPENIVIASVRNEDRAKPILDLNLPNVKIAYYDMGASEEKIIEDFKVLKDLAPNGIDVVIQNAAVSISDAFAPTLAQDIKDYYDTFHYNVAGSVKFYKAVYPYLIENKTKLTFVSSLAGSNGDPFFGGAGYGASKAALNHVIRQIARETNFITVVLHPGLVITDMSKDARERGTFDGIIPLITAEESAGSMLAIVDKLTKEDNDKFFSYDGTMGAW